MNPGGGSGSGGDGFSGGSGNGGDGYSGGSGNGGDGFSGGSGKGGGLDARLLEVVVCPSCHGELRVDGAELACTSCDLVYPVVDDIPVLLIDRARRSGKE